MKYVFKKRRYVALMSFFDFIGNALIRPFQQKTLPLKPHSILIVRMDHIGDVLLATPLPRLLKQKFPEAKIYFLTSSLSKALLKNNKFIDEILVYDAPWFSRDGIPIAQQSFWRLVNILKAKNIELALAPRGDIRENTALFFSGIPHRLSYGVTGGGFLLSREAHYDRSAHEIERGLHLLQLLGIDEKNAKPELFVTGQQGCGPWDPWELTLRINLSEYSWSRG